MRTKLITTALIALLSLAGQAYAGSSQSHESSAPENFGNSTGNLAHSLGY